MFSVYVDDEMRGGKLCWFALPVAVTERRLDLAAPDQQSSQNCTARRDSPQSIENPVLERWTAIKVLGTENMR
jgi:hypothetical protein